MIVCKKVGYDTRKEAKKRLKEMKNQPLYLRGKYIKKARQIYQCNNCGKFHVTSSK